MNNLISVQKIFDAQAVALSTAVASSTIDRNSFEGKFSLQLAVTGDGTIKVEYQLSNDGVTYSIPEGVSELATGLTKTSGPESDGKVMIVFEPGASRYIKIRVTETVASADAAVTGWLGRY